MTQATIIGYFKPATRQRALVYDGVLLLTASLLLALAAQVAVHLPFSPVPITMQTFAVLLIGAIFGAVRAGLAVLLYLAEGLAGLPVFSSGGFGPAHLLGPTGGYLVGFVPAAVLTGYLAERGWDRRFVTTLIAMILGTAVIFAVGVTWLSAYVPTGERLTLGLWPFLPGAGLKIVLAALVLPGGWRMMPKDRHPTSE